MCLQITIPFQFVTCPEALILLHTYPENRALCDCCAHLKRNKL